MKTETIYIDKLHRNIEFVIGSNAQDNWDIIDVAESCDIWFHVDGKSSCHVIAKIDDMISRKERGYIVKKGAELCKRYSKYKSERNLSIVYTKIENIEKTDVLGSVIVKSGKGSIIAI